MTQYEQPHGLEFATEAAEMFAACVDILRSHHPYVQGVVLADLLAMFIAGYRTDDPEATARMRETILAQHIDAVREWIKKNEEILAERQANLMRHHH